MHSVSPQTKKVKTNKQEMRWWWWWWWGLMSYVTFGCWRERRTRRLRWPPRARRGTCARARRRMTARARLGAHVGSAVRRCHLETVQARWRSGCSGMFGGEASALSPLCSGSSSCVFCPGWDLGVRERGRVRALRTGWRGVCLSGFGQCGTEWSCMFFFVVDICHESRSCDGRVNVNA